MSTDANSNTVETRSPDGSFFSGLTHVEAIARMLFLVEHRRRMGLILGGRGYGKTLVLHTIARELRGQGVPTVWLGLVGLDSRDLLSGLAGQLGARPRRNESTQDLWRVILDAIAANTYQELTTAILLDDVDGATAELRSHIVRLAQFQGDAAQRLTIVVTAQRLESLETRLVDQVDLRTDLEPWDAQETARFVNQTTDPAKSPFSADAIARLHELSGGVPRQVAQLVDLASIATAGQGGQPVDVELVESVHAELLSFST